MTLADAIAALATVSIPSHWSASNPPPVTVNGVTVLRSNLAAALSWSLNIVRAARRRDWRAREYAAGWIQHSSHDLRAVHRDFEVALLVATSSPNGTGNLTCADDADLEQLDVALCDTIERVDRARGCGWYDKGGRLNHRPPAFEASAAVGAL